MKIHTSFNQVYSHKNCKEKRRVHDKQVLSARLIWRNRRDQQFLCQVSVKQDSKKFQKVHSYKNLIVDRRSYDKLAKATTIIQGKVFNHLWKIKRCVQVYKSYFC